MNPDLHANYIAPDTKYFKTKEEFNKAVSKDFVAHANQTLISGKKFLVGLSHGQSPAGAYQLIVQYFSKIKNKKNIYFTFVNSPLKTQENLTDVFTASQFLKKLVREGLITKEQVLGRNIHQEILEEDAVEFNNEITNFLKENKKTGFDYVFLATNSKGRIAGIERNSKAFDSNEIATIVSINKERELTLSTTGKENESPSFLRYINNVKERVTVFIDDKALTWPELEIKRETPYGVSNIRLDLANAYKPTAKEKLPVVLLIHGFLGLNSFDGLLTTIPSTKYIAAAMHYGSIPNDLPIDDYSKHVAKNIDAVIGFFGDNGHAVYVFDHSMGNIYFLMMDKNIDDYPNFKKYLKGRIGANPFFGEEAKHALLGFLDNVIIPSMSFTGNLVEKSVMLTARRIIPLDSKTGVRKRGINLSESLITKEESEKSMIWKSMKDRIVFLMTNMDSLPHLNRIPIERALNKVPPKIFAIQSHSALQESMAFDRQVGLVNMSKYKIPILILKSERDGVAKFVPRLYQGNGVEVVDITHPNEKDLFREHLYHMVNPQYTAKIIDEFISKGISDKI